MTLIGVGQKECDTNRSGTVGVGQYEWDSRS